IIMAQQQHATDVHPDELCPPNKRYDLMDANKKVDLEHKMDQSIDSIMYAEVFRLDVHLTQSQPTESTQGTHKTPSALRSPNPATETAESMPSAEKDDEMILQDMIQVSLAEHKSREEQEARENVALVYEHLAAEEIEKLVEDPENVDDSSPPSVGSFNS
ncbi:hypothetical protein Tco_0041841, partial [Tanacetum coccineum]